jgi:hypothetical protein
LFSFSLSAKINLICSSIWGTVFLKRMKESERNVKKIAVCASSKTVAKKRKKKETRKGKNKK